MRAFLFCIALVGTTIIGSNNLIAQKVTERYENGNKKYQGKTKDGVKVGKHTYWFENGEKQKEETYNSRGINIGQKVWNETGELIEDINPEKGFEKLRNEQFKSFEWINGQNGIKYMKLKGRTDLYEPLKGRTDMSLHYATYLFNGRELDSSFRRKKPVLVNLANNSFIEGFVQGLGFFEKGDNGYIIVPSYLGYGEDGARGIPPNAVLVFQIMVIDVI